MYERAEAETQEELCGEWRLQYVSATVGDHSARVMDALMYMTKWKGRQKIIFLAGCCRTWESSFWRAVFALT
jgi:hypothetical protein